MIMFVAFTSCQSDLICFWCRREKEVREAEQEQARKEKADKEKADKEQADKAAAGGLHLYCLRLVHALSGSCMLLMHNVCDTAPQPMAAGSLGHLLIASLACQCGASSLPVNDTAV